MLIDSLLKPSQIQEDDSKNVELKLARPAAFRLNLKEACMGYVILRMEDGGTTPLTPLVTSLLAGFSFVSPHRLCAPIS